MAVSSKAWDELKILPEEDRLWEVFHENSKLSRLDAHPPNSESRKEMLNLWTSLPFVGYPAVPLPQERATFQMGLGEAIENRVTARRIEPSSVRLDELAAILHAAYGETRSNDSGEFPRPFRTTPSAGALYPLEIFMHTKNVESIGPGVYHFNPSQRCLRRIIEGDMSRQLAEALLFSNVPYDASIVFFLTAIFERSTFKYGERGYRFALLEAGHVAQNINLAATGLGMGVINIGGYFDREVDRFLGIDGVRHATVYLIAIGRLLDAGTGVATEDA